MAAVAAVREPPAVVDVLLVDDVPINLSLLRRLVERIFQKHRCPVRVTEVDNGADAEKALCRKGFKALSPSRSRVVLHSPCSFCLSVMDNQMPGNPGSPPEDRGIKVAQSVRTLEDSEDVKDRVLIIAHSSDEQQDKFRAPFFDAVVKKGSRITEFEIEMERLGVFDSKKSGD